MVLRIHTIALLGLFFFSFAYSVLAEDALSRARPNDFLLTKWTTDDGLPQSTVTSIVQTSDGYIWLGTFGGLARFDGIKFTIFDTTNSPGLTSNRILSLYEDRRKRLWVGTETGEVYVFVDGKFINFQTDQDYKRLTVWQFVEDDEGRLYIASDAGLERVDFQESDSTTPWHVTIISRSRAFKAAKGPDNTIWVANRDAFLVKGDRLVSASSVGLSLPSNILDLVFAENGTGAISAISSFGHVDNGRFSEIKSPDNRFRLSGCTPAFRYNDLWCQEGSRLHEFSEGGIKTHDISEFVTAGTRAILFDEEDNIWLATQSDGLVRLTRRTIALLGDMTDLNVWGRYAIAQDGNGTVWVAGHDLLKVQNSEVKSIPIPNNVAGAQLIKALAVDRNDVLWAGGLTNLYVVRNDVSHPVPNFEVGPINALFFDRQNNLWVGSEKGLWRYVDGQIDHITTTDGLVGNNVRFITQTKDDTLWIGAIGGVSKFKDGKFENLTPENGLSGNYVREILEDDDGTIWIGTYGGGINRLRDGKLQAITTSQGLQDNFISRILVDDENKFWILGNLGIFAVDRAELNAVADHEKSSLIGSRYGVADGMKSSEASGGHQYAGIRTRDGRMWFPMIQDVVIIDPKLTNKTAPKVVIEEATTRSDDGRTEAVSRKITGSDSISIPTGQRDLEIRFTGLSFTKPESIRFYYKLDGVDKDWTDAGVRRSAFYPFIPPGSYTFQVKAVSANGVVSENTAVLTVVVDKYFWQTWWFTAVVFLAAIFVGVVLYRYKSDQIEARRLRDVEFAKQLLNAQETERGRIATELHDGLGQNLLILKNWAQLGLDASEDPAEVRDHLRQISETAAQSIDETRAIVRNLSPQNLKRFGLSEAIRNMVEQLESSTGVLFNVSIENIDGIYPEEGELSIYRIIQECLNNIVRHSESPRGDVKITRLPDGLSIIISDYGKGFTTHANLGSDESKRGFGVRSIIQRVELLGGEVSFESRMSEGTTIRIKLYR